MNLYKVTVKFDMFLNAKNYDAAKKKAAYIYAHDIITSACFSDECEVIEIVAHPSNKKEVDKV